MRRQRAVFYWLLPVGLVACLLFAAVFIPRPSTARFSITADRYEIAADGRSEALLGVRSADGRTLKNLAVQLVSGSRRARIVSIRNHGEFAEVLVRSGTAPGPVTLSVVADDVTPQDIELRTMLDASDTVGDGTPDFLRLDDPGDRRTFREWFTYLAEHEASRDANALAPEINDCAALIRYAYRESLREHDGQWATELRLQGVPGSTAIEKYNYPYTALGAPLFRVRAGAFTPEDVSSGAFAQFADAEVLSKFNTFFVSRDIERARPGDLLFFRQLAQRMPYHVMIFVGRSHFEGQSSRAGGALRSFGDNWLVYHTGPNGKWKGEIRRVRLSELMNHPDPRWRPYAYNHNFLGVYRWNILRAAND